jgi:hypothetical protein
MSCMQPGANWISQRTPQIQAKAREYAAYVRDDAQGSRAYFSGNYLGIWFDAQLAAIGLVSATLPGLLFSHARRTVYCVHWLS